LSQGECELSKYQDTVKN